MTLSKDRSEPDPGHDIETPTVGPLRVLVDADDR